MLRGLYMYICTCGLCGLCGLRLRGREGGKGDDGRRSVRQGLSYIDHIAELGRILRWTCSERSTSGQRVGNERAAHRVHLPKGIKRV